MKKYFVLICCLVFLPFLSISQEEKHNFQQQLKDAKDVDAAVEVYVSALNYFSNVSVDSMQLYTDKALAYCKDKNYKLGEAKIISQLALIDDSQGRINLSIQRVKYALDIYRQEKYTSGVANLLSNLGSLEASKGNFKVGVEYFLEAIKLQDSLGSDNGSMIAYMNIGSMYLMFDDLKNAEKYLKISANYAKKIDLSDKVISLYNLIGVVYAVKGQKDSALIIFLDNLEKSSKNRFVESHVECLSYLGNYYFDNKDDQKAISYLEKGLELATKSDMMELKSNLLVQIAMIHSDKHPELAIPLLQEATAITKEMGNQSFLITIYEAEADMLKRMNNFKDALELTEKKQKIKDSLFSINKAIELTSITSTHELEKSTLKVQELERLSERNAIQRNSLIVIVSVVVLLLIVTLYYFRKINSLNHQLHKQQEELKDLNNMKDKLFSIVGHDLRGPVARLPVLLDVYEDPDTSAEEKKYLLDSLREHNKSLMEMLDKLLFWGQSLVKGIRMQAQVLSVNEIVRQNIELKKLVLQEKSITITDNVPQNLKVNVDITHFDFIVRNLISNAIKYTFSGGAITISADADKVPGFVVMSVKDTGTGIAADVLAKVFAPEQSIPGTADEKGTGIGLMLCKEFAYLNGGDIWAESVEGQGATFYFKVKKA